MTTPVGGTGSGAHDEVLAGEYVLGALPPEAARQVEARLKTDRQFAAMVLRWRENLSDLDEGADDPWLMTGMKPIDGAPIAPVRIAGAPATSIALPVWRGFGIALFGFLAIYAVYAVREALTPAAPVPAAAVTPLLKPIYDPAAGRIALDAVPSATATVRVWLIDRNGQAEVVGEMPANGSLPLDAGMKQRLSEGANLAIAPAR